MKCPRCDSTQLQKNGNRRGKQNYRCKNCGTQFIGSYSRRGYSEDVRQICLRMYQMGLEVPKIQHLTGISHSTIRNWIRQAERSQ